MALFHAKALLDESPVYATVLCDFFKIPEGEDYPTITLKITNAVREAYRQAEERYRFAPKYTFTKGKGAVGEITDDPIQFCHEILNAGYEASEGLIDEPTKPIILTLLKREPGFARKLAAKLVTLFEHDDLYQEQGQDEKN